jgi:hypothetical protein
MTKKKPAKKPRTRKGKRQTRYITGTHVSSKALHPINYRSSWELYVCKHLDEDNQVLSYEYEPYKIAYISNTRSGRVRFYIPDFVVKYVDGSQKIIEVKRTSALNNNTVVKKAEATKRWCESLTRKGMPTTYEFWTEAIIFPIRQRFLLLEKQQEKKG